MKSKSNTVGDMDYYQNNTSYYQTQQPAYNVNLPGYKPEEPAEQAPQVSSLARRIHGWSWQAVRDDFFIPHVNPH